MITTSLVCLAGYVQKLPCRSAGFDFQTTVRRACYTDIYPLFFGRGLAEGKVPYLDKIEEPVEYPVLTGWFMHAVATVARWAVHPLGMDPAAVAADRGMAFYDLTAAALALLAIMTVLATASAAGSSMAGSSMARSSMARSSMAGRGRLRAGLLVAAAPGLLLAAYINWDLLAVALGALSLAAWARRRHVAAGMLLGLAISAKFYPVVFLVAFFLVCLRAGKWREFGKLVLGTAGGWICVNLPIMVLAWDSWVRFYTYSQERPVDWGSVFFFFERHGWSAVDDVPTLNHMGEAAFAVLCVGIAVLALAAPRRPRLPQLLFLVLAAFMLTNKVWSPQYVLWLLPLVALARPRVPGYLLWQAGEVVYFLSIWWYLLGVTLRVPGDGLAGLLSTLAGFHLPPQGIDDNAYFVGMAARLFSVLLLVALVVVDIVRPDRDVVRSGGIDDPAGGVLDGAADRFILVSRPAAAQGTMPACTPGPTPGLTSGPESGPEVAGPAPA